MNLVKPLTLFTHTSLSLCFVRAEELSIKQAYISHRRIREFWQAVWIIEEDSWSQGRQYTLSPHMSEWNCLCICCSALSHMPAHRHSDVTVLSRIISQEMVCVVGHMMRSQLHSWLSTSFLKQTCFQHYTSHCRSVACSSQLSCVHLCACLHVKF